MWVFIICLLVYSLLLKSSCSSVCRLHQTSALIVFSEICHETGILASWFFGLNFSFGLHVPE